MQSFRLNNLGNSCRSMACIPCDSQAQPLLAEGDEAQFLEEGLATPGVAPLSIPSDNEAMPVSSSASSKAAAYARLTGGSERHWGMLWPVRGAPGASQGATPGSISDRILASMNTQPCTEGDHLFSPTSQEDADCPFGTRPEPRNPEIHGMWVSSEPPFFQLSTYLDCVMIKDMQGGDVGELLPCDGNMGKDVHMEAVLARQQPTQRAVRVRFDMANRVLHIRTRAGLEGEWCEEKRYTKVAGKSTEVLFTVGDVVILTQNYKDYADAGYGPLKPGDTGKVTSADPYNVIVEANGRTWRYDPKALVNLKGKGTSAERGVLVRAVSSQPGAVAVLYDRYVPMLGQRIPPLSRTIIRPKPDELKATDDKPEQSAEDIFGLWLYNQPEQVSKVMEKFVVPLNRFLEYVPVGRGMREMTLDLEEPQLSLEGNWVLQSRGLESWAADKLLAYDFQIQSSNKGTSSGYLLTSFNRRQFQDIKLRKEGEIYTAALPNGGIVTLEFQENVLVVSLRNAEAEKMISFDSVNAHRQHYIVELYKPTDILGNMDKFEKELSSLSSRDQERFAGDNRTNVKQLFEQIAAKDASVALSVGYEKKGRFHPQPEWSCVIVHRDKGMALVQSHGDAVISKSNEQGIGLDGKFQEQSKEWVDGLIAQLSTVWLPTSMLKRLSTVYRENIFSPVADGIVCLRDLPEKLMAKTDSTQSEIGAEFKPGSVVVQVNGVRGNGDALMSALEVLEKKKLVVSCPMRQIVDNLLRPTEGARHCLVKGNSFCLESEQICAFAGLVICGTKVGDTAVMIRCKDERGRSSEPFTVDLVDFDKKEGDVAGAEGIFLLPLGLDGGALVGKSLTVEFVKGMVLTTSISVFGVQGKHVYNSTSLQSIRGDYIFSKRESSTKDYRSKAERIKQLLKMVRSPSPLAERRLLVRCLCVITDTSDGCSKSYHTNSSYWLGRADRYFDPNADPKFKYNDAYGDQPLKQCFQHHYRAVCVSPDSAMVAAISHQYFSVWSLSDGRLIQRQSVRSLRLARSETGCVKLKSLGWRQVCRQDARSLILGCTNGDIILYEQRADSSRRFELRCMMDGVHADIQSPAVTHIAMTFDNNVVVSTTKHKCWLWSYWELVRSTRQTGKTDNVSIGQLSSKLEELQAKEEELMEEEQRLHLVVGDDKDSGILSSLFIHDAAHRRLKEVTRELEASRQEIERLERALKRALPEYIDANQHMNEKSKTDIAAGENITRILRISVLNHYEVALLCITDARELRLFVCSLGNERTRKPVLNFKILATTSDKETCDATTLCMVSSRPCVLVSIPDVGVAVCSLLHDVQATSQKMEFREASVVRFDTWLGQKDPWVTLLSAGACLGSLALENGGLNQRGELALTVDRAALATGTNVTDGVTPEVLFIHDVKPPQSAEADGADGPPVQLTAGDPGEGGDASGLMTESPGLQGQLGRRLTQQLLRHTASRVSMDHAYTLDTSQFSATQSNIKMSVLKGDGTGNSGTTMLVRSDTTAGVVPTPQAQMEDVPEPRWEEVWDEYSSDQRVDEERDTVITSTRQNKTLLRDYFVRKMDDADDSNKTSEEIRVKQYSKPSIFFPNRSSYRMDGFSGYSVSSPDFDGNMIVAVKPPNDEAFEWTVPSASATADGAAKAREVQLPSGDEGGAPGDSPGALGLTAFVDLDDTKEKCMVEDVHVTIPLDTLDGVAENYECVRLVHVTMLNKNEELPWYATEYKVARPKEGAYGPYRDTTKYGTAALLFKATMRKPRFSIMHPSLNCLCTLSVEGGKLMRRWAGEPVVSFEKDPPKDAQRPKLYETECSSAEAAVALSKTALRGHEQFVVWDKGANQAWISERADVIEKLDFDRYRGLTEVTNGGDTTRELFTWQEGMTSRINSLDALLGASELRSMWPSVKSSSGKFSVEKAVVKQGEDVNISLGPSIDETASSTEIALEYFLVNDLGLQSATNGEAKQITVGKSGNTLSNLQPGKYSLRIVDGPMEVLMFFVTPDETPNKDATVVVAVQIGASADDGVFRGSAVCRSLKAFAFELPWCSNSSHLYTSDSCVAVIGVCQDPNQGAISGDNRTTDKETLAIGLRHGESPLENLLCLGRTCYSLAGDPRLDVDIAETSESSPQVQCVRKNVTCLKLPNDSSTNLAWEIRPLLKASSSQWFVARSRSTENLQVCCVPQRGTLAAEVFKLNFFDIVYTFITTNYGFVFATCYDIWFIPKEDLRRILERLREEKSLKIEMDQVRHVFGYTEDTSKKGMYNVKYVTNIRLKDGVRQGEPRRNAPDTDFAFSMTQMGKDVLAVAFHQGLCVQFFQYNAVEKSYSVTVSDESSLNRIQMAYLARTYSPDAMDDDSKKSKVKVARNFILRYGQHLIPHVCRFSDSHICVMTTASVFFYPKPLEKTSFKIEANARVVYGKILPVMACVGAVRGAEVPIKYSYQGRQDELTLQLPKNEKAKQNQENSQETKQSNDVKAIAIYENDNPELMVFVLMATELSRSYDLVVKQKRKQEFTRVAFWSKGGPQDAFLKEIDSWDSMLVSHDMHYVVTYSQSASTKAKIFDGQMQDVPWDGKDFLPANKVECACFSRDSAFLVFCTLDLVLIISCDTREVKFTIQKDTLNLFPSEKIGLQCHSSAVDSESSNSDHVIIMTSHQRLIYQSLFSPLNFVITPKYLIRDREDGVEDSFDRATVFSGMVALWEEARTREKEDTFIDARTMVAENTDRVMLSVPELRKRSGKWYFEVLYWHHEPGTCLRIGWADDEYLKEMSQNDLGDVKHTWACEPMRGVKFGEGSQSDCKLQDVKPGSRIGCAIDFDEKHMWFSVDGVQEDRPMTCAVVGDVVPCVSGTNLSVQFCAQLEGSGAVLYPPPPRSGRKVLGSELHSQVLRPIPDDKFSKYGLLKAGLESCLQVPDMNFTSSPVEQTCLGAHAARIRTQSHNSAGGVWWRPAERQLLPAGQRGRGSWLAVDLGSELFVSGLQLQVLKGQRVSSAKLQVRSAAPDAKPVEYDLEDDKQSVEERAEEAANMAADDTQSAYDNMYFKMPPMRVRYIHITFLKCQVGPRGFGLRMEVFHKVPMLMDFVAANSSGQDYNLYYGNGQSPNLDLQVLTVGVANKVTFGDLLRAYTHKTKDYQLKSSGLLYDMNKFKLLRASMYVSDQWQGLRQVQWTRQEGHDGRGKDVAELLAEDHLGGDDRAIDEDLELRAFNERDMVLAPGFGAAYRSLFHEVCSSTFDKLDEILIWLLKASVQEGGESLGLLTRALPMVHLLVHSLVPGTGASTDKEAGYPHPVAGNALKRPMDIISSRIVTHAQVSNTDAENLHMSITLVKTMLPHLLDNLTSLGEEAWWHVKNVLGTLPGEVIIGFEIDKALLASPIRRESGRSLDDGVGVNTLAELNVVNVQPLGDRTGHMRLVVAIPGILGDAWEPKKSLLYRVTHPHEHGNFMLIRNGDEYSEMLESFCRLRLVSSVIKYKWNTYAYYFFLIEFLFYMIYLGVFTLFSIEYASLEAHLVVTDVSYLYPLVFITLMYFLSMVLHICRDGPVDYFVRGQDSAWNVLDVLVIWLLVATYYQMFMTVYTTGELEDEFGNMTSYFQFGASDVANAVSTAVTTAAPAVAPMVGTPAGAMMTTTTTAHVESAEERRSMALIYLSVTAVLFWIRSVFYGLGFQQTGQFVRIVYFIFIDIRYFFMMLLLILFGFAHGLYLFFHRDAASLVKGTHFQTIFSTLITAYRMLLGDYPIEELETHWMTLTYFIFFTLMVTLTLLNVLIAKMNDSYVRANNNAVGRYLMNQAVLTAKLESKYRLVIDKLFGRNGWVYPAFTTWVYFESEIVAQTETQQLGEISEIRSELQRHSNDVRKIWDSVQRLSRSNLPPRRLALLGAKREIEDSGDVVADRTRATTVNVSQEDRAQEQQVPLHSGLNQDTVRSVVQESIKDEFISQNLMMDKKLEEVMEALRVIKMMTENSQPQTSSKGRSPPAGGVGPVDAPSAAAAPGSGAASSSSPSVAVASSQPAQARPKGGGGFMRKLRG